MVIEFLTFTVPDGELATWLEHDERHWTRFLADQPGFVRKEVWRSNDDTTAVHAVVWWASIEQWKSVPQAGLDRVVAAMGPHERHAECVSFDLLRST